MGEIIIMPKQGLQMTEGIITTWLVNEGDEIKEGEPLFEMETDKLAITIDSTASGTLLKILCEEDEIVAVADPIAVVGEPGEDYEAILAAGQGSTAPGATAAEPADLPEASQPAVAPVTEAPEDAGHVFASPRAKTCAKERGIDYHDVPGSGPLGMVIERDILNAQVPGARVPMTAPARGEHQIPVSNMRRIIAQRMTDSLNTLAQANHRLTVDMSAAVALRRQLQDAELKVSYNDIVIRCVAKALTEFPMMNSTMDDQFITTKDYVNIGMAVATDEGLLVPVIRDADLKTLPEISQISKDLATRTKENKLTPDELTGGTFTVSNLGMFDIESFTAIINKPEAGILAVGKMEKKPVVCQDEIVIRPLMQLSLTYDHRIVDGAPAALFLRRIKQLLEHPGLLI
ncbi:MAG: 2-oxo acid dehydrogenase subunit E2 [Lachnospiraceae bacterium]|nr:2-oxo acid dehydrogenase subunit E2 [Lachnospiraceae bacterium]